MYHVVPEMSGSPANSTLWPAPTLPRPVRFFIRHESIKHVSWHRFFLFGRKYDAERPIWLFSIVDCKTSSIIIIKPEFVGFPAKAKKSRVYLRCGLWQG